MMFIELDHGAILRKETGLDSVHLTYDKMSSLLTPYGNAGALAVARDLDTKIERLLRESSAT